MLLAGGVLTVRGDEAGKLDEAKEIVGVVLPANEDPALPLNPGEETLCPTPAPGQTAIGCGGTGDTVKARGTLAPKSRFEPRMCFNRRQGSL
jgi:hypothetical protein